MGLRAVDCHSHSCYSPDSTASVEEMCLRAVELGLKAYALTDHCECDSFVADHFDRTIPESRQEILRVREKINTCNTRILTGVELGQPIQNYAAAESVLNLGYDMVIGSIHRVRGYPDFYFMHYKSWTQKELEDLMEQYFNEVYELVLWNQFDTLGHLTYPLRYIVDDYGRTIDMTKYDDIIDEIFKKLMENGKAMEINTSGAFRNRESVIPSLRYLKRYRQLGGEFLTMGSDAHEPAALGCGLLDGMKAASEAGFQRITYFENRKPVTIAIEE